VRGWGELEGNEGTQMFCRKHERKSWVYFIHLFGMVDR
jgi:imidazoleglycerol phosphate synthase glutamine amidotransferase subunit HisH